MSDSVQRVAIVGGGFSGTMLAARLAERGMASTVIDRTGRFGPGVAYATAFDGHLLNVRADRMSAVEGRPDDFVRWLQAHHPDQAEPEGFAPRRLYGLYLQHRLAAAEATNPSLIVRETGAAVAIESGGVRLADGRVIAADVIVLATGNPPPRAACASGGEGRVIGDPWAPDALAPIGEDDPLVILGAGLTMVDIMLQLTAKGWRGRAVALSRHGLTSRAHDDQSDAPVSPTDTLLSVRLSERLAEARRLAAAHGWRAVMEGVRPITARLWSEAHPASRGRFLRHLRPWWDVHRHRLAAPVAAALDAMSTDGRLRVVAGRVQEIASSEEGVEIAWRERGSGMGAPLRGRWLIDCTGPAFDPGEDPITARLLAEGRARLEPLGLGLDLDADGRALGADGTPDGRVFVLGPPARGAYWETTAVPDIRKRIEKLVEALTGAGGQG